MPIEDIQGANPTAQPQDIVVPNTQVVIAPGGGPVDPPGAPFSVDGVDHVQIAIPMSPIDSITPEATPQAQPEVIDLVTPARAQPEEVGVVGRTRDPDITGETPFPKRPKGAWEDRNDNTNAPLPVGGPAVDADIPELLELVHQDENMGGPSSGSTSASIDVRDCDRAPSALFAARQRIEVPRFPNLVDKFDEVSEQSYINCGWLLGQRPKLPASS